MNLTRLISVVALVAFIAIPFRAEAQARRLTERVVNSDNTPVRPAQPGTPAPQRPNPTAVAPVPRPLLVNTNVIPEKTKAQKDEMVRKTIAFQKKQAEAGAPTAQYDLGVRYLNGDGVEKDSELARKWLNASATNGNTQAAKKLLELEKK